MNRNRNVEAWQSMLIGARAAALPKVDFADIAAIPGDRASALPLVRTFQFMKDPLGFMRAHVEQYGPVYRTHLMGGYQVHLLGPAANELVCVHVFKLQVQPDPDIETRVSPDGTVSVTVTGSTVEPVPVLLTRMVYCAFCCPGPKLPTCDLVIPSTGGPAELATGKVMNELGLQPELAEFRTAIW